MGATPRLVERGGIFYFRMAVPKQVVARIGRSELTCSLRTRDPLQAKRGCRTLSNAVDRLFEGLPRMLDISQTEIESRIRSYFQSCLNKGAELVLDLPNDQMIDISAEIAGLREDIERMQEDLTQARFSQAVTLDAQALLNPASSDSPIIDKDVLKQTQIMILGAKIEHFRIVATLLHKSNEGFVQQSRRRTQPSGGSLLGANQQHGFTK